MFDRVLNTPLLLSILSLMFLCFIISEKISNLVDFINSLLNAEFNSSMYFINTRHTHKNLLFCVFSVHSGISILCHEEKYLMRHY